MDILDDNISPEDYKNLAEELGVSEEAVMEMDQRMGVVTCRSIRK
jgi:hypothetical protein